MRQCVFCKQHTEEGHLAKLPCCDHCKRTFELIKGALDNESKVLFVCKACDFKCDVPGVIKWERVGDDMRAMVEVDSQHNYCQNCGEPSKRRAS